jgi:hypothetical protein
MISETAKEPPSQAAVQPLRMLHHIQVKGFDQCTRLGGWWNQE